MGRNLTRLVVRSVSMVVLESKVLEEETEIFFLQCFIWEYNPKPTRVGERENKTGKDGKP